MRRVLPFLLLALAAPAFAQERDPVRRQTLVDLAHVLGEAHALRQLCNGQQDQFWRDRMMGLLETEDADFAFSERLRSSFNTGYVARQSRHLACSRAVEDAEAEVSAQGQSLARKLAAPPNPPPADPDSVARPRPQG